MTLAGMLMVVLVTAGGLTPTDDHAARKHYVGHSPAACESIDYACPHGWTGFQDSKGCGCLEPASPTARDHPSR